METNHLNALELRLSNERLRLAKAKTDGERAQRSVWVRQIEKEIATERGFIGADTPMSDADMLRSLGL